MSESNAVTSRLRSILGLGPLRSDRELTSLIEKGLPVKAIRSLIRGGLSDLEVYSLIVPRRTLAHRRAKHQPLSKDESDKAVRVARVAALAEDVLGDTARAWGWLRKPKRRFDGKTPIEMLVTEAGARLVEEMIVQLDYGMVA